jgi:hypothetical protein
MFASWVYSGVVGCLDLSGDCFITPSSMAACRQIKASSPPASSNPHTMLLHDAGTLLHWLHLVGMLFMRFAVR